MNYNDLRENTVRFLKHLKGNKPWEFKFSSISDPNLIGSSLAVMLTALIDTLDTFTKNQKKEWADYLNSFQKPSGFFYDEDINDQNRVPGYTAQRALFHRTRHAFFALSTLGYPPKYSFHFLNNLMTSSSIRRWMTDLDLSNYWDASNKIMDLCLFLNHEATVRKNQEAKNMIRIILDVCDQNTNPKTGYHDLGKSDLRNAMAGAMHIYPLYFLHKRKPLYPEQVIKTTLSLQQSDGLFGYDPGSGGEDCLDYDAVNILVNFSFITNFMHNEIKECLHKVLKAIEHCSNPDGGFCCHRRNENYRFGTFTTEVSIGASSLWSTYSRLLTIAMSSKVVNNHLASGGWNLENNMMEIWNGGI